jgi:hypothetical protein
LFNFFINDKQYTNAEISSERYGRSTSKQVTMKCSEVSTPGVNSDDSAQGEILIPSEMQNIYSINLEGVAGNQQLTIAANYMLDNLMFVLRSGTNATVKAGTTIGGDQVVITKTLTTANPVITIDREYLANLAQYEAAWIIYYTIAGVGATIDINAIIKRYKES